MSIVANGSQDIWVREFNGAQRRITSDPGAHFRPIFTPDGKQILYVHGDTTFEFLERNANGLGNPRVINTGGSQMVEGTISRDGAWLVTRGGGQASKREIVAMRRGVDSVGRVISSGVPILGVSLSPDARYIAYTGYLTEQGEVYVSPFPDIKAARWQVSVKGGSQAHWSADGREIFYVTPNAELMSAKVATAGGFAVTSQERVLDMTDYLRDTGFRMYQYLPETRRFIMLRPEPFPGDLVVVENWFREIREKLATK
jgi:Tol biopolymer transport system component